MTKFPQFKPFSETSILVEWPSEMSPDTLREVLKFKNTLKNNLTKPIVEITNAYNSLLIKYDATIDNFNGEFLHLKQLFEQVSEVEISSKKEWYIPVCYDVSFGWDLASMAASKNITNEDLIALHLEPKYLVYFIGFLPGFLYLGGLPPALHFPRLKHPRSKVIKGAVGIGGEQTGIYPNESPGGWNIIGNCPINLFDSQNAVPCFIEPGDRISFKAIGLEEHQQLNDKIARNQFDPQILLRDD